MTIRRTIALSCVALFGCVTPPAGDPAGRAANPAPPGAAVSRGAGDASASDASLDAAADASPSPVAAAPVGPFLPAPDAERYHALVSDLIIKAEGSPSDGIPHVVFTAGGPRKLVLGDGSDLTVIPVQLTFDGYTNAYCRLAVLRSGTPAPGIVPIPMTYDDQTCSAMRKLAEADLNHDGIPDLVFELTVKWNRGPGKVPGAAVYLSDRSRMTYCFASHASEAVMVVGAYTASRAVGAIESEVRRRGQEMLACAKDLPEERRDGGPGAP